MTDTPPRGEVLSEECSEALRRHSSKCCHRLAQAPHRTPPPPPARLRPLHIVGEWR
jgi:hypothetical protein